MKRGEPGYVSPMKGRKRGPIDPAVAARVAAARRAVIPPLEVRFWSKVDKNGPNGCWVWTGAKRDLGYGNFGITENGKYRCVRAYAMAWKLTGHELPKKPYVLDHICKNPPCVNPAHLRAVTQHFNSTVNSVSPHAENSRMTHCKTCGNAYAGANLAMVPYKHHKTGKPSVTRACLTCYPDRWMYAVIERGPPPGVRARKPWRGPANRESC